MTELRIVFLSSLLCIILGVGVIIGGAVAVPVANNAINSVQATALNYLQQADNTLSNAQNTINTTLTTLIRISSAINDSLSSLTDNIQLINNIDNSLNSVGSRMSQAGDSLSNSFILNALSLGLIGGALSGIGQRVNSATDLFENISSGISSLQQNISDRPSRIVTLTIQLGNLNNTFTDIRSSIAQTQDSIVNYFNPVRLVAFGAIAGFIGLGVVFLMIGLALFSLRRKTFRLTKTP
jgi:uncharacterized phage infection (PIP) family protein YhgE